VSDIRGDTGRGEGYIPIGGEPITFPHPHGGLVAETLLKVS